MDQAVSIRISVDGEIQFYGSKERTSSVPGQAAHHQFAVEEGVDLAVSSPSAVLAGAKKNSNYCR